MDQGVNMDEIKVEEGSKLWHMPPEEPASDPKFIKHVRCDGARFHVLSWSTKGTHCSEPRCIVNKNNAY